MDGPQGQDRSQGSKARIVQVEQDPAGDAAALEVTVGLIGVYVDDLHNLFEGFAPRYNKGTGVCLGTLKSPST